MAPVANSYSISRQTNLTFPRRVFSIAGWYGLIVMLPQYFLEAKVPPPPLTHPEHYYGFVGVTIAWQVMFLIIARDPVRYRTAMLAAMIEKFSFVVAIAVLYAQGRVAAAFLPWPAIDLVLGTLFVVSYRLTRGD